MLSVDLTYHPTSRHRTAVTVDNDTRDEGRPRMSADETMGRREIGLRLVPVTFAEASAFVDAHHRHHRRPRGHKFSIGAAVGDTLVGVAMVGRPVARHYDDGLTLEVNRTATDGTHNANSLLYGAAWRAAKAMGYARLITYPARKGWTTPSRARDDRGTDGVQRTLWEAA